MVLLVVFVTAVVSVAIWLVLLARRDARDALPEREPSFPLIYPVAPAGQASIPPPVPLRPSLPTRRPASLSRPSGPTRRTTPAVGLGTPDAGPVAVPDDEPDDELEASSTVRFRRPAEHAVQLLPGRLEVLAGETRHTEIRLVRVAGERPEIILGREQLDTPGHVALRSPTVSRRHARLSFADGVWTVANLSQTNPVVVNDAALPAEHERRLLDGDRLELGEVALRFHAR